MASSSLLPNYTLLRPSLKLVPRRVFHVRCQSFRDEGKFSNIVDANLSLLRERIEKVKVKERLERCCRCEYGWTYEAAHNINCKLKRRKELSDFIELLVLVCTTLGFTFLSGTFFLCLVSLFVHLDQ